jgi:excisionase family DNA binding protein
MTPQEAIAELQKDLEALTDWHQIHRLQHIIAALLPAPYQYPYTMTEAARVKGCAYDTISRAVRAGKLKVHRVGKVAYIKPDDLMAWEPMSAKAPSKYRGRRNPQIVSPEIARVMR